MKSDHAPVLKVLGADFELTNALVTDGHFDGRPDEASRRLLQEIDGYPHQLSGSSAIEYGRRFLPGNGGSFYIDSTHLEGNLPEHTRSRDHALHVHAALRIARGAQQAASEGLPRGTRLSVIANNSDGRTAWGAHLNAMLSEQCFHDLHYRKPHLAGFLATHEVTSVMYTGGGLVGAANGRGATTYQWSQRADWFTEFAGLQTMHDRPLINLRAEHHAEQGLARCHIIYFDMVLSPDANWLKAGTTQLVLAMIEAGFADPTLLLDDPVAAASEISRDLSLKQRFRTAVRGRTMTALEIQAAYANLAGEFVASGAAGAVPEAEQIVAKWRETLDFLQHREAEALARSCDCWLKYLLIERMRGRRGLAWSSGECRVADLGRSQG